VSHAQLFHGPEGSRKLAMAIAYAQFINCPNRKFGSEDSGPGDACGSCPSCIQISKLAHPDLHFIFPVATSEAVKKDPVSKDYLKTWREVLLENDFRLTLNDWYSAAGYERKQGYIVTDDCNEILRTLSYKSYESEFKVMIIWMADRLHSAAAPKILKILEEPPDKSLFILISENPEKIVSTILSRTQTIKFRKLSDVEVKKDLTSRLSCSAEEADRIVPVADGNLTRAVKILKQDENEAFNLEKFITWMRLCLKYQELDKTFKFVTEISKIGREKQKSFLSYALRIIRNGLLVKYHNPGLTRLNQEEEEFLKKFVNFINHETILIFTEELEEAQYHIDRNANPAILFMDLSMTITNLLLKAQKDTVER
jgi:DNA polymerase-3 subunit delta'